MMVKAHVRYTPINVVYFEQLLNWIASCLAKRNAISQARSGSFTRLGLRVKPAMMVKADVRYTHINVVCF